MTAELQAQDSLERSLQSIWVRLLQDDHVPLDVDFFDAGGDSILAAQLFSEIERELGFVYPLTVLTEAGTVRALAELMRHDAQQPSSGSSNQDRFPVASIQPIPEKSIVEIWRELLGTGQVGPDSDFFEAGGNGELALRMREHLAALRGGRFPLATLVGARTPRDLSRALDPDSETTKVHPSIVLLRDGPGATFFCFSGRGTDVLRLRALARNLDPSIRTYGVRGIGLAGGPPPPPDMILLIEIALEELLEIQPSGPYHIGGHSGGGRFAIEIARRLRAKGERVNLVAMIDTANSQIGATRTRPPLWKRVAAMRHRPRRHMRNWLNTMTRRIRRVRGKFGSPTPEIRPTRWTRVGDIYVQASRNFTTAPYDGAVVFYRPPRGVNPNRADTGWEHVLPNLDVVRVTGGHVSMLDEPHVLKMADDLSSRILSAENALSS